MQSQNLMFKGFEREDGQEVKLRLHLTVLSTRNETWRLWKL